MGGLLYSLNFSFFCPGVRGVPFVPIYNITALIKMVGGWAGSGLGLGFGWVGGRNSCLKILLLVFVHFANAGA